jgi:hypothetical protein
MKTLGIWLAFGDIYAEGGLGAPIVPYDGSTKRLKRLLQEVARAPLCKWRIVTTAGYSKRAPRHQVEEREVSLADQQARWVTEEHPWYRERLLVRPLIYSTRNEIKVGMKQAVRSGFYSCEEPTRVVVASHPLHLVRIALYCVMYCPRGWQWKLLPVWHQFSFYSYVHEFAALARDLCYGLTLAYRLYRFRHSHNLTH